MTTLAATPMKSALLAPGATMLGDLKPERFNLCLAGPSGAGKTTGAASFIGGDLGKAIFFMIEHGQQGGAGGATPLLYLKGINDRVRAGDVMLLRCQDYAQFQKHWQWVVANAAALVDAGYTTMIWDGITELARMGEDVIRSVDRAKLPGGETERQAAANAINRIFTDIDGKPGTQLQIEDYGRMMNRMRINLKRAKSLPFTFICTALDGEMRKTMAGTADSVVVGVGPDLVGNKMTWEVLPALDYYFHCERRVTLVRDPKAPQAAPKAAVEYVWLTMNDPLVPGNPCRFFAKHRAGLALDQYEPADGAALLRKLKGAQAA